MRSIINRILLTATVGIVIVTIAFGASVRDVIQGGNATINNLTANSIIVPKTSGTAGVLTLYNNYLTEVNGFRFRGPTGHMDDNITAIMPATIPSDNDTLMVTGVSDNTFTFVWRPKGSTGTTFGPDDNLTTTGVITGNLMVDPYSTSHAISASEARGSILEISDNMTLTMPAKTKGMSFCVNIIATAKMALVQTTSPDTIDFADGTSSSSAEVRTYSCFYGSATANKWKMVSMTSLPDAGEFETLKVGDGQTISSFVGTIGADNTTIPTSAAVAQAILDNGAGISPDDNITTTGMITGNVKVVSVSTDYTLTESDSRGAIIEVDGSHAIYMLPKIAGMNFCVRQLSTGDPPGIVVVHTDGSDVIVLSDGTSAGTASVTDYRCFYGTSVINQWLMIGKDDNPTYTTVQIGSGITDLTPPEKLDIKSATNRGIRLKQGTTIDPSTPSTNYYSGITLENTDTLHSYVLGYATGANFGLFYFDGNHTYSNPFLVDNTGAMGIGKTPSYKLDVNGSIGGASLYLNSNQTFDSSRNLSAGYGTFTPETTNKGIKLKQVGAIDPASLSTTFYDGIVLENTDTTHAYSLGYVTGANFGIFYNDGNATVPKFYNRLEIDSGGSVGVGKAPASGKLDVDGAIVGTALVINGYAADINSSGDGTFTGRLTGKIYTNEVTSSDSNATITGSHIPYGAIIEVSAANVLQMDNNATAGLSNCVKTVGNVSVKIRPKASDRWVLSDETLLDEGHALKNNSTAGDTVCWYGSPRSKKWVVLSTTGTWSDNGS